MTSALWTVDDLSRALGAAPVGPAAPVHSVSIDTRTLEPGALFVALKDQRDGHDFVDPAFEKGASAAVVATDQAARFAGHGTIYPVADPLAALVALGRAARVRHHGATVAVTGSVGKTTTKEMLRLAFGRMGPTHASVASYNNHWGVPLTLARMPAGTAYGVFEIGMNHPFEILPLVAEVRPQVAIVTAVEPVHLAQFHGIEGIADAKGEVFSGLEPGGVALLNGDSPLAGRLRAHAAASPAGRVLTFGANAGNDVRMLDLRLDADSCTVRAEVLGVPVAYRIGAPGRHLALNSLAVLGAVRALGGDLALAALALRDFSTGDGRGRRLLLAIANGTMTLIDESYNANPTSMRAAIAVAGSMPRGARGRRIAVLGDMLELGPDGANLHAGLIDALLEHDIDLIFACGPLMKNLWQALPASRRGHYAENSAALESVLLEQVHAGDVVVVKGSLGSRMGRIVAALKARYPEAGAAPVDEV